LSLLKEKLLNYLLILIPYFFDLLIETGKGLSKSPNPLLNDFIIASSFLPLNKEQKSSKLKLSFFPKVEKKSSPLIGSSN
jgi:hypothetical protein